MTTLVRRTVLFALCLVLLLGVLPRAAGAADPAAETREKLTRKGVIDGQSWSVTLKLTATSRGSILDFLSEAARAKPRKVNVVIDRQAIQAAGVDLDEPVDLDLKRVSLKEALDAAMGDRLAWGVRPDGVVLVTVPARLKVLLADRSGPLLARPTRAAALTTAKLAAKGIHNGEDWSLRLDLTATSLGSVLDFLAEAARARPRELNLIVDRAGIAAAGVHLDDPVDFRVRNVSIGGALGLALPEGLGYAVLDGGEVLITTAARLKAPPVHCAPLAVEASEKAAATRALVMPAAGAPANRTFDLDLDGVSLDEALRTVGEAARRLEPPVNVVVNRKSIEAAGGARLDAKVSAHLEALSVAQALAVLLPPELAYTITADGDLMVCSRRSVVGAMPAAVQKTRETLARSRNLTLDVTATAVSAVVGLIAEAGKHQGVAIVVDPQAFTGEAGEAPIDVNVRGASIGWALDVVLGNEAAWAVRRDGSVFISTPKAIEALVGRGDAFVSRVPPYPAWLRR